MIGYLRLINVGFRFFYVNGHEWAVNLEKIKNKKFITKIFKEDLSRGNIQTIRYSCQNFIFMTFAGGR